MMNKKRNGSMSESRKIHYYSGHDSSIVTLQVVLGIPSSDVIGLVRPGSALILELHQNSTASDYYVQVSNLISLLVHFERIADYNCLFLESVDI